MRSIIVYIYILLFTAVSLKSQTSVDTSSVSPKVNFNISISKFDNTNIVAEGDLDENVWNKIPAIGNFVEIEPRENVKPEVETKFKMFYDAENLYIGFICYDNDISKLRKTLTDRDKIFNDDWVGFFLDAYGEKKQAYEIIVNPLGIQGDLMWSSPGNEDSNFDAIWYSGAKIYKDKWTAEIVIPFKSLRFPNRNVQVWNFHILRNRPRTNREQYSLFPISRDDPTLFTKSGELDGIKNIKTGKNLEVLPYALSSQSGAISDFKNSDSKFDNKKIIGQVGLNLKYGITSNLTADFAINPDFSQVESDAAQIDVNNPYALFYNEKRPFFIEGSNIFSTPSNVVYTRAINNPLSALKLTGKIGKFDIGIISAYDRNSPFIIPFEEKSDVLFTDRKSFSNIFRIKRSLNNDSYIGFILTDREVNKKSEKFFDVDGYNRVFGFDGKYRFLDNYSFTFQALKYITKEINYPEYDNPDTFEYGKYTAALDGENYSGYSGYVSLERSARHWNFNVDYSDLSPVARRDDGFISVNNYRRFATDQSYVFYPETKLFNRITPGTFAMVRHNYDGKLRELFLETYINIQFAKLIYLNSQLFITNNEEYGGIYHEGARRFSTNININTFDMLQGGMYLALGKYIIRNDNPSVGWGYNLEFFQTFKPIDRLVIENDWNYFELAKNYGGEKLYAGYILRNKSTFQYNKNLSLRLITQYDSFSGNFNINPLLNYKLNPFTIFYIGSTYNYDEIANLKGVPNYILSGRQYFLKFQYLWRI